MLLWDGDRPLPIGRAELYGGVRQAKGACHLGPRAIGTVAGVLVPDGVATLPVGGGDDCEPSPAIPLGRYRVTAWGDVEHEAWEGEVTIAAGQAARLDIALERAWRVDGALVADLHVHAARSNDSGLADTLRAMSQVCAGVQVTALSDHASNGDLTAAIAEAGLAGVLASVPSNEIGSDVAHLGVYPTTITAGPRGGSPDAAALAAMSPTELMAWGHRQRAGALVQVNHPRFRMYALFDNTGWDGARWPPPFPLDFDAVEVLAGHTAFNAPGDRRIDQSVRDFYALIDHGAWVTGVGTSDTHHLNGVLDGVARTYVLYDDPRGWASLARAATQFSDKREPVEGQMTRADQSVVDALTYNRNNRRLPAFFQLDLRVERTWRFRSWNLQLILDVLNSTYNREIFACTLPSAASTGGMVPGTDAGMASGPGGALGPVGCNQQGVRYILPSIGLRGVF